MARSEMAERQKSVSKILNGRSQLMASRINQPRNSTVPMSRKYCYRKINHSEIPAIQITGTNVAPELRKRKLIRRPGDVCAEIVYEK